MPDDRRKLEERLRVQARDLRNARKRVRELEYRISRENSCLTPGCGNPVVTRSIGMCLLCYSKYASSQPVPSPWDTAARWTPDRWAAWRDPGLYCLAVLKMIVEDLEGTDTNVP